MGVHQLWTIVAPCGRPIKLETLNQRRLAVDASIWIYQFLKAVRDKEGNVLRNSHIVGFYYRICKLLYHGIKPVFVFDGGAPALKRRVITERKKRREGKRDDAVKTAGRLLAVQMQRRAEEEQQHTRESRDQPVEEPLPEELAYAEELGMSAKEKQRNRQFKKKDQYHLPDLEVSLAEMGGPDDPRVMSHKELEDYAKQFKNGEDVSLYDFSKIDFDSPMFTSLPAADRYNILNAKRLRSRLRMGLNKEQLGRMFPDSMAFSRFQMERVRERNELTQRLMNINGMAEDFAYQTGRIAGEKGKEYILVQNAAAEGGWVLGVVNNNEPINLDADEPSPKKELDSETEDDEFEDIPIEGLNKIPKKWVGKRQTSQHQHQIDQKTAAQKIAEKRKVIYSARKRVTELQYSHYREEPSLVADSSDLFISDGHLPKDTDHDDEPEDLFEDVDLNQANSDEDLQKAIEMSLEQSTNMSTVESSAQFADVSDDEMDLQAALEESRKSQYPSTGPPSSQRPRSTDQANPNPNIVNLNGPLPFESLDLGRSILGQKKAELIREAQSGGFDRDENITKKSQPLPPWFNVENHTAESMRGQQVTQIDEESIEEEEANITQEAIQGSGTQQVIDVDAEDRGNHEVINVDADQEGISPPSNFIPQISPSPPPISVASSGARGIDSVSRMEDLAERMRAKPPIPDLASRNESPTQEINEDVSSQVSDDEQVEWSDSDKEDCPTLEPVANHGSTLQVAEMSPSSANEVKVDGLLPDSGPTVPSKDQDSDDDALFVDVDRPLDLPHEDTLDPEEQAFANQYLIQNDAAESNKEIKVSDAAAEASDHYDSDTDEELFAGLAAEAEASAQFASGLNQRSTAENLAVYEDELKRLRAQQKRDRRDADEVTNNMTEEVQILLGLFGLPYITAPMEAEAQCAELVRLGLVDGVVTDDSDIFLFGGTRVYKNFFNGKKNVELYLASDLEKEYNLTRDKLIASAQILGSDYAEHLKGIGPVKALELLSEWGSLPSFRAWWDAHQLRDPKDVKTDPALSSERKKFHKHYATNLMLPTGWPSLEVEAAYWHPTVDSDTQRFEWGIPQLNRLRDFFMATIGWSPQRTDEILVPIVRDMAKREREGTQANVTRYFEGSAGTGAAGMGKRGGASAGAGAGAGAGGGRGGAVEAGAPTRRVESSRMARALGRLRDRDRDQDRGNSTSTNTMSTNMSTNANDKGKANGGHDSDSDADVDADVDVEPSAELEPQRRPKRRGRGRGNGNGNTGPSQSTAKRRKTRGARTKAT